MGRRDRLKRKQETRPAEPVLSPFAAQHGEYGTAIVVDLDGALGGRRQSTVRVFKNLYPNIVDRWLSEGGCGFEEPQRRAIDHCLKLWATIGTQRLVANYSGSIPGGSGEGSEAEIFARAQLQAYEDEFLSWWKVFEDVLRFEVPASRAGTRISSDRNAANRIAQVKNTVGFIASKIAEWRGY